MREAFALQTLLIFFQQKMLAYFRYCVFEILTKCKLSLVLNNWARLFKTNDVINGSLKFQTLIS